MPELDAIALLLMLSGHNREKAYADAKVLLWYPWL